MHAVCEAAKAATPQPQPHRWVRGAAAQAGVAIGVLLNALCPPWLITVLLILLMSLMCYQSINKVRHAAGQPLRFRGTAPCRLHRK